MGFILEDRMPNGIEVNGWYGGQHNKYDDMIILTAEKRFAEIFDNENDAKKIADDLNKYGWKFVVLEI